MLPPYLPPTIVATLVPFAPLFSRRLWAHVQVLVAGALLAPARRTVAAALRILALAEGTSASTATIACSVRPAGPAWRSVARSCGC